MAMYLVQPSSTLGADDMRHVLTEKQSSRRGTRALSEGIRPGRSHMGSIGSTLCPPPLATYASGSKRREREKCSAVLRRSVVATEGIAGGGTSE